MSRFNRTPYFHSQTAELKSIMTFKRSAFIGVVFWVISPLVVFTVLGWYIADILFPN